MLSTGGADLLARHAKVIEGSDFGFFLLEMTIGLEGIFQEHIKQSRPPCQYLMAGCIGTLQRSVATSLGNCSSILDPNILTCSFSDLHYGLI